MPIKHFQNLSNYNVYSSNRVVDFYNIDHWFQKNVQKEICFILDKIDKEKSLRLQNLFKVSFLKLSLKYLIKIAILDMKQLKKILETVKQSIYT